jgi:phosphoribosylanthranilate isomerase
MTRVKICGITNCDDAHAAIELGADAVGFVFAPSKRRVTPEQARRIITQMPPFAVSVGVFMNDDMGTIRRICDEAGIDIIQLHGNEHPSVCATLHKRVIKGIKIEKGTTTTSLISLMDPYCVSAFLLDPGTGSGHTFDWSIAREIEPPVIIAGGLDPGNVAKVVRLLHPHGVDVSSGVEHYPGKKDRNKMKAFIEEVRQCS